MSENGSGKSTLLEAIAVVSSNAEGGTCNYNFSTAETHSDLKAHTKSTNFLFLNYINASLIF